MKTALLSFLLAFCISCMSCLTPRNIKDIYIESESAVYLLEDEGGGKCTSFHIGDGYLLTAAHCIKHEKKWIVIEKNEVTIPVNPVAIKLIKDIALFQVPELKNTNYLVLGENYSIGQQITVIGFPGYTNLKIVDVGHLIGLHNDPEQGLLIIGDGNLWPGESGGPLFDERGFVIGLAKGVFVHNHQFKPDVEIQKRSSVFVSTKEIKEVIKDIYTQNIFPPLLDN